MFFSSINYDQPVFRPPGESLSSILQVTLGCSWNRCAFCEMYSSKQFHIRKFEDIRSDIRILAAAEGNAKKVFLADGNAFVLKTDKLLRIIKEINGHYKRVNRISSYALPTDIINKSKTELSELRQAGLKLLYIGIETGDDDLLRRINKSETYESTYQGINKAHEAGIDTSVMILTGLGGENYSRQHAINSAKLVNLLNPKFLSTLSLSLPLGQAHFEKKFNGTFIHQTKTELAEELKLFIENLTVESTIFRSDHVSNNIVLKGVLSKDKRKLIETIDKNLSRK